MGWEVRAGVGEGGGGVEGRRRGGLDGGVEGWSLFRKYTIFNNTVILPLWLRGTYLRKCYRTRAPALALYQRFNSFTRKPLISAVSGLSRKLLASINALEARTSNT